MCELVSCVGGSLTYSNWFRGTYFILLFVSLAHTDKPLIDVNVDDNDCASSSAQNNCDKNEPAVTKRQSKSKSLASQPINGMLPNQQHAAGETYQLLPDIAQMSLEPFQDEDLLGDDTVPVMSLTPRKEQDVIDSFLLIDEFEKMHITTPEEFAAKLGCSQGALVKVVSIFGNTGEGKSHTLNYTFFDGKEVFKTSPAQSSCTIGIWAAYDPKNKVITIDTEGLLGVSENNNRRTRLLLKVLAISDVIIYRTRAERLHNDLFSFLGDASRAYLHHFSTELRVAAQRCSFPDATSISDLGPVVVVFHETLHTDVLRAEDERTPEDALRSRFRTLGLSTEAFSGTCPHVATVHDRVLLSLAFEYVGTRTAKPPTCFKNLRASMRRHLTNSTVRSARTASTLVARCARVR